MSTLDFLRKKHRLRALPICVGVSLSFAFCFEKALALPAAVHDEVHTRSLGGPNTFVGDFAGHVTSQWVVKNCNDHGTDSLRAAVGLAAPGESIVFDTNAMACSRISLTTGQIDVTQDDLVILGPKDTKIVVSAEGQSRVLNHSGTGVLAIYDLAISDGHYSTVGKAYGGCIRSAGSIWLNSSNVDNCALESLSSYAFGGGIAGVNDVQLLRSRISNSRASASISSHGGGIFSRGNIDIQDSAVEFNDAGANGFGGGISSSSGIYTYVTINSSTFDHNTAYAGSASNTLVSTLEITNSTISDNQSSSAAVVVIGVNLYVWSSTIAFNQISSSNNQGALFFYGAGSPSSVTLNSSIIAKNTSGAAYVPADFYVVPGPPVALDGADNLIIATSPLPQGVVTTTADPRLGPLQYNGGTVQTRALQMNSPALGSGNNVASLAFDQRGVGYPRTDTNTNLADMGAIQFDRIFVDGFEDL
jgi:hypothetical protein